MVDRISRANVGDDFAALQLPRTKKDGRMDGWKGEEGREGTYAARKRAARTAKEVCELRDVRNFSDAERHRVFVAPLAPLDHRAGTAANCLLISTAVNALEYCCSFSQQNEGDRHIGEPGSKHRPLERALAMDHPS